LVPLDSLPKLYNTDQLQLLSEIINVVEWKFSDIQPGF
jgi:hypothetical protein